jgi:hypothetical protein
MPNIALNAVAGHDFMAFVQMCHKILNGRPLDGDKYLEYSCHVAQEFADGDRTRLSRRALRRPRCSRSA